MQGIKFLFLISFFGEFSEILCDFDIVITVII